MPGTRFYLSHLTSEQRVEIARCRCEQSPVASEGHALNTELGIDEVRIMAEGGQVAHRTGTTCRDEVRGLRVAIFW